MIKYADFTPEQQRQRTHIGAALSYLPLGHRVYTLWSELSGLLAADKDNLSVRARTALTIALSALWEGMQDEV